MPGTGGGQPLSEFGIEACVGANRALAMRPDDPVLLYNIACTHANAGSLDRAMGFLEDAVRAGFAHRRWCEHDAALDPLRPRERFRSLFPAAL
jgi:hypothetical protein